MGDGTSPFNLSKPEAECYVHALQEALGPGRLQVFNTDQGSQFTSGEFTQVLQDHEVKVSMDRKGRYADNTFMEQSWCMMNYEEVCLKAYAGATEAQRELEAYFRFYNDQDPSGPRACGHSNTLPPYGCRSR